MDRILDVLLGDFFGLGGPTIIALGTHGVYEIGMDCRVEKIIGFEEPIGKSANVYTLDIDRDGRDEILVGSRVIDVFSREVRHIGEGIVDTYYCPGTIIMDKKTEYVVWLLKSNRYRTFKKPLFLRDAIYVQLMGDYLLVISRSRGICLLGADGQCRQIHDKPILSYSTIDIDFDGVEEIIFIDATGRTYIYDTSKRRLLDFERNIKCRGDIKNILLGGYCLGYGDIDNDGKHEVFFAYGGDLHIIRLARKDKTIIADYVESMDISGEIQSVYYRDGVLLVFSSDIHNYYINILRTEIRDSGEIIKKLIDRVAELEARVMEIDPPRSLGSVKWIELLNELDNLIRLSERIAPPREYARVLSEIRSKSISLRNRVDRLIREYSIEPEIHIGIGPDRVHIEGDMVEVKIDTRISPVIGKIRISTNDAVLSYGDRVNRSIEIPISIWDQGAIQFLVSPTKMETIDLLVEIVYDPPWREEPRILHSQKYSLSVYSDVDGNIGEPLSDPRMGEEVAIPLIIKTSRERSVNLSIEYSGLLYEPRIDEHFIPHVVLSSGINRFILRVVPSQKVFSLGPIRIFSGDRLIGVISEKQFRAYHYAPKLEFYQSEDFVVPIGYERTVRVGVVNKGRGAAKILGIKSPQYLDAKVIDPSHVRPMSRAEMRVKLMALSEIHGEVPVEIIYEDEDGIKMSQVATLRIFSRYVDPDKVFNVEIADFYYTDKGVEILVGVDILREAAPIVGEIIGIHVNAKNAKVSRKHIPPMDSITKGEPIMLELTKVRDNSILEVEIIYRDQHKNKRKTRLTIPVMFPMKKIQRILEKYKPKEFIVW